MEGDSEVPDSGALFTFGRSRFTSDSPGKFWIRDDPILQVSCGDEHTALLTASGRVFTFGSNEWGQLGHGHTNAVTKPSCVKGLKHERVTVITCGRSHTLVATDSGHVYGFGANSEGQLGSPHEYTTHTAPIRIQGLEGVTIKMLSGGAEHSMALTDRGVVYVWGTGSEGQLGTERNVCLAPTEVRLDVEVMCISAGYYHSAFVTVDGNLFTCGESDCGKLGTPDIGFKKSYVPQQVMGIPGHVMYVACGGNHTIALTADGKAYSFGSGFNGQLGLGDRILEADTPHLISSFESVKIARASCGENHSAFLTDSGYLYTCGDSRHGKLALLNQMSDTSDHQFFPALVQLFAEFRVQQVACGGCHMLVLASKRQQSRSSDYTDGACPARARRRIRNTKLPPLQSPPSVQLRNNPSMTSLRNSTLPQLPNIAKSPVVWYVPLENTGDISGNRDNDDDDEVLSKVERHSLLDDLEEDKSIRHVDSDVESETSEPVEMNKTHTLVRIDNTISIVRPVISDEKVEDQPEAVLQNNEVNDGTTSTHVNDILPADQSSSPIIKGQNPSNASTRKKNKEGRRSQFYDNTESPPGSETKSSTSTLSKSSKACVVL